MKCNHCNTDIPDDSKFCPSCGHKTTNPLWTNLKSLKWNKVHTKPNFSLKTILLFIAAGIWILVLQNLGIIPISQDVRVTNRVDTYVNNRTIEVEGSVSVINTVEIEGTVSVDNY